MRTYLVEPFRADRNGVEVTGRALIAARVAAQFSAGEIRFTSEQDAEAAAKALSERGPDGLRVVWRVKVVEG